MPINEPRIYTTPPPWAGLPEIERTEDAVWFRGRMGRRIRVSLADVEKEDCICEKSSVVSGKSQTTGSLSVNYFADGDKLMVRYWRVKEQIWSEASEVDLVEAAQRLQLLENQFIADNVRNDSR